MLFPFYQTKDTIAAIATPPGEGGVAIVRISGSHAKEIATRIFSGPIISYRTHTAHLGQIRNSVGEHIDDALALVMWGKRSYTGEDTVELHCHGGSLITRRVLTAALAAGARSALPGEFTFRAFINGKIDLIQAEAVQSLICAKNEHALNAAEHHLKGHLSQRIASFQKALTQTAAILEAWVDFPEEGLEFTTLEELNASLESISQEMKKLLVTFCNGRIVHDGLSICLVGCPNVGKSSLLNALLDRDRAIVSAIPGTTRDVLEDHMRIHGLHCKLSDTAGIRETDESIEREGIRRSKEAMHEADLVLFVLDAQRGLQTEDEQLLAQVPNAKTIGIWNKIDLPYTSLPYLPFTHIVQLSAKEKRGLEQLLAAIHALIWQQGPPAKDEVVLTNVRHHEALERAVGAIHRVQIGLQNEISPEFLTLDMRQALVALGQIIGTDITEDILSSIFSQFCIGK